jgi:hypothetical protein
LGRSGENPLVGVCRLQPLVPNPLQLTAPRKTAEVKIIGVGLLTQQRNPS